METIGWISSLLLGGCAFFEVIHTVRKGRNDSSWLFLLSWYFGEIGFLIYVFPKMDLPLLANYLLNIVLITILLKYKLKPKNSLDIGKE